MNDSDIIALFNNRDEAAVKALNERFGGLCRSIACNVLSDMRDVEECVSSVYFKLWNAIPPARPADLTAYIAKAARNEALSRYRSNSAKRNSAASVPLEELEDLIAGSGGAEDEVGARAMAAAVDAFVLSLPALQRAVFMRRYWFFDSARVIASRLGITERRVYALLAKTGRELRKYLIREEFINE